eukprot:SAG31_NODE_6245_length_2104_cov_2.041895_2_plen_417_part_01
MTSTGPIPCRRQKWDASKLAYLASYLPRRLLPSTQPDMTREFQAPCSEHFDGAILFLDISGFSKLSSALLDQAAKQGLARRSSLRASQLNGRPGAGMGPSATAAMELRMILEQFCGGLMQLVLEWGGDVVRIAGDALIAVFAAAEDASQIATERAAVESAATAAAQCCGCGLEALQRFDNQTVRGRQIRLHAAACAGQLSAWQLGGVDNQYQYVVCGPAFLQLEAALDAAAPGELVGDYQCWKACEAIAEAELAINGGWFKPLVKLNSEQAESRTMMLRNLDWPRRLGVASASKNLDAMAAYSNCDDISEAVSAFVSPVIVTSVENINKNFAGDFDEETAKSVRLVTVAFFELKDLSDSASESAVVDERAHVSSLNFRRAQAACIVAQTTITNDFGGLLKEFTIDDKGCVLVALWWV